MVFHLQQCKHLVCRKGACLEYLHSCKYPLGRRVRQEVCFLGYVVSNHVVLTFRCLSGSHFTLMLRTSASTTHQLVRTGLWSRMKRLMEAGVMPLANRSKSCQKVEESSKSPKNLKGLTSCKGHRFRRTITEAPVLHQWRTRASVTALWQFFEFFVLGPRISFEATFASIINKAKLMELLMLCHNFS